MGSNWWLTQYVGHGIFFLSLPRKTGVEQNKLCLRSILSDLPLEILPVSQSMRAKKVPCILINSSSVQPGLNGSRGHHANTVARSDVGTAGKETTLCPAPGAIVKTQAEE